MHVTFVQMRRGKNRRKDEMCKTYGMKGAESRHFENAGHERKDGFSYWGGGGGPWGAQDGPRMTVVLTPGQPEWGAVGVQTCSQGA